MTDRSRRELRQAEEYARTHLAGAPRYFMLRVRRDGPLVPAHLWWCDHEPGEPENKRYGSRWPELYPCADIAGAEVPPEDLIERLWWPSTHWKCPQPISETEYRYQLQRIIWAERNRVDEPALRPRRALDPAQLPLPDFERENAIVGGG